MNGKMSNLLEILRWGGESVFLSNCYFYQLNNLYLEHKMNNRNKLFYSYNLYNKSDTIYIRLQHVAKHQLGLFVRLQPPGHQPCLVKALTLDLGAPTPRTPILLILRHQPQGLQPSAIYCLEMFSSYSLLPTLLDLQLTSVLLLALRLSLFLPIHQL